MADTGWKKSETIIQTPTGAAGSIAMPTGTEEKPCFTCARWHKDTRKLEQFLKARHLTPDSDGRYQIEALAKEFKDGRQSMKIDLKDWGFCLTLAMPTHMMAGAGCEHWKPTVTRSDLGGKIK